MLICLQLYVKSSLLKTLADQRCCTHEMSSSRACTKKQVVQQVNHVGTEDQPLSVPIQYVLQQDCQHTSCTHDGTHLINYNHFDAILAWQYLGTGLCVVSKRTMAKVYWSRDFSMQESRSRSPTKQKRMHKHVMNISKHTSKYHSKVDCL